MKIKKLNKYLAFSKGSVLQTFAYKFSIYGWMFSDFLEILCLCLLWIAIFKFAPDASINGYTLEKMLAYVIFARIVYQLVGSGECFWILAEDIREGNIAVNLTKPINYRYRLLASDFGSYCACFILLVIPVFTIAMVILYFTIGVPFPNWYNFIFFIISSVASLFLLSNFKLIIGQLAFFTGSLFGIGIMQAAVINFLSGGAIPIAFFPETIQKIFHFLPFTSMLETPTLILLNGYTVQETLIKIAIQIGWLILFNLLSAFTFNKAVKHVTSNGG